MVSEPAVLSVCSRAESPSILVDELCAPLENRDPRLLLLYLSCELPATAILKRLQLAHPNLIILGCTSWQGAASNDYVDESPAAGAMWFLGDELEIRAAAIDLESESERPGELLAKTLAEGIATPIPDDDASYFLVFHPTPG